MNSPMKSPMKAIPTLSLSMMLIALTACSQNTKGVNNIQKAKIGKVVSVTTVTIKPEKISSYGNLGMSIGSGGHSGVYGTVDISTLGKLYRNATQSNTAQRIIVTKSNGETVAITQVRTKAVFKTGDNVKLLVENGKAKVIH